MTHANTTSLSCATVFFTNISRGVADTNFIYFSTVLAGTNINLRFALSPGTSNNFTLDENTILPDFTTRPTTLGGGSNAWNFASVNPGYGRVWPNPSYNPTIITRKTNRMP